MVEALTDSAHYSREGVSQYLLPEILGPNPRSAPSSILAVAQYDLHFVCFSVFQFESKPYDSDKPTRRFAVKCWKLSWPWLQIPPEEGTGAGAQGEARSLPFESFLLSDPG